MEERNLKTTSNELLIDRDFFFQLVSGRITETMMTTKRTTTSAARVC